MYVHEHDLSRENEGGEDEKIVVEALVENVSGESICLTCPIQAKGLFLELYDDNGEWLANTATTLDDAEPGDKQTVTLTFSGTEHGTESGTEPVHPSDVADYEVIDKQAGR